MNTVIEGVHIVPQLQVGNEDSALELLRTYYAPLDADGRGVCGRTLGCLRSLRHLGGLATGVHR